MNENTKETLTRVVFVDRDGTLVEEPDDFQVDRLDKVRLVAGVVPSLLTLVNAGFELVMVTNQDGRGTDSFPEASFRDTHAFIIGLFASQGITFAETFVCPHTPRDACPCRKPKTGLVDAYVARRPLDRPQCSMVGDRPSDIGFADALGIRGYQLGSDLSWPAIARDIVGRLRRAEVVRETRETRISVAVEVAEAPHIEVHTGIGFFDHMLEQIAKHAGFSLTLRCDGDLHVDEHHTVEDCALALGDALKKALGDKRGLGRYGFVLPMDEAEARVSLDLSGRAFSVFRGELPRPNVGALPTELVPHFFRSFADALGATLHIEVRGDNTHHMVESCFKGLGRSLRMALRLEGADIPSSKGVL